MRTPSASGPPAPNTIAGFFTLKTVVFDFPITEVLERLFLRWLKAEGRAVPRALPI
jgi:hypothetical protein